MVERVIHWLADNPPPNGWRGGCYAWAYAEMPLEPGERFTVKRIRKGIGDGGKK
ncbi:hypothetical protein [Alloalcanivorax mobilis]|uniref:hypothetical protein n=1 Tax=Alloalcanivorax mobilis TaxID=2019569 RepID=UPI0013000865|nr:hypothetical protein [Alloalcanivorax mobilis]